MRARRIFVPALVNILVSASPERVGYAFLPFTFKTVAASTIGLMLGGVFVQYAQWQDLFACISIVAVILAVVAISLPSEDGKRRPFDYVGIGLLFVPFVTFRYVEATVIAYDDLTRIFGILLLVLIPTVYFIPLPAQRRSPRAARRRPR